MNILHIYIPKANASVKVDIDDIPDAAYRRVFEDGLKLALNRTIASKIGSIHKLKGEEQSRVMKAALEIAERNLRLLLNPPPKKRANPSGLVMTEARRIAKEIVKNNIKAKGLKVANTDPAKITEEANALIKSDPRFIEEARRSIEARAKLTR